MRRPCAAKNGQWGTGGLFWIYDLRAKVQASRGIPERGNLNTTLTEP